MQRQRLIIILLILATLCAHGAAQRMLDAREVADVLRVLTREPVTTWISSGVMRRGISNIELKPTRSSNRM